MNENLINELKLKLIESLNLDGVNAADIEADTPLFSEDGLGLDSIDALELVVMLERDYKISVSDNSESKQIFASLRSIAEYILSNGK